VNATFLPLIAGVPSTASFVSGEPQYALPGSVIEPLNTLSFTASSKMIAPRPTGVAVAASFPHFPPKPFLA
jgi:hypothetical protein